MDSEGKNADFKNKSEFISWNEKSLTKKSDQYPLPTPSHLSPKRALCQTGLLKDSLTPHAHQVISHRTILIFYSNPYYQKYFFY